MNINGKLLSRKKNIKSVLYEYALGQVKMQKSKIIWSFLKNEIQFIVLYTAFLYFFTKNKYVYLLFGIW